MQNKLSLASVGTRADIATTDEKHIDALDIYVFGSTEIDGEYTFQEKFSYRVDGPPSPVRVLSMCRMVTVPLL